MPEVPLREIFVLVTRSVSPTQFGDEVVDYYSLPAYDEFGGPAVSRASSIGSSKTLLPEAVVLVSKLNPRIPRVQVHRPSSSRVSLASTEFMAFQPLASDTVSLRYFRHYFGSEIFGRRLEAAAIGTTGSHTRVRPSDVLRWRVPVPPLEEQLRIAEVLDTVDDAIRKQLKELAKLRQVRAGLADDLLSGQVRTAST